MRYKYNGWEWINCVYDSVVDGKEVTVFSQYHRYRDCDLRKKINSNVANFSEYSVQAGPEADTRTREVSQ